MQENPKTPKKTKNPKPKPEVPQIPKEKKKVGRKPNPVQRMTIIKTPVTLEFN